MATKLFVPRSTIEKQLNDQLLSLRNLFAANPRTRTEILRITLDIERWQDYTKQLLKDNFGSDQFLNEFANIHEPVFTNRQSTQQMMGALRTLGVEYENKIISIISRLGLCMEEEPVLQTSSKALSVLDSISGNFPSFADQALKRQRNRRPLCTINDEYDLQDIVHAILRLFFKDIRAEEWTPSYAGEASRMDFFLKPEGIAFELKMTRAGLDGKKVGQELIVDTAHYAQYPHCNTLFCFVYDPDLRINNPVGLERDLAKNQGKLSVKVVVAPKI